MGILVNRSATWCTCIGALVLPISLGLSGCSTQLTSVPLNLITDEPVRGIVYYLPKTVLDVDITLQLKDCRVELRGTEPVFHFDIAQSVIVTEHTVADTSAGYVVNYEDLSASTKTTFAAIELTKAGTLKSLNFDVKDQTAMVISNTVSSAMKIASIISRIPSPTAAGSESDINNQEEKYCGAVAKLALRKIRELESAASFASASEEKSRLTEKITAIRLAELTHRMFVRFDPRPTNEGRSVTTYPKDYIINGWISPDGRTLLAELHPELFTKKMLRSLHTEVAIAWPASVGTPLASNQHGIVYRQPLEAEVAVCTGQCGSGSGVFDVPRSDRVYSAIHRFPQFGQLAVLPLRNGVFQDNVLKIDWDETNNLTRVEFSNSSQADKASAAILDTSGKVAQYIVNRRAAQAAAVAKAREDELADLAHRKAVLDALIELKKSQDAYEAGLTR